MKAFLFKTWAYPLEKVFREDGAEMLRRHAEEVQAGRRDSSLTIDSYEQKLIGARVEGLIEAMVAKPFDRKQVNRQLRSLMKRVVVDYPNERLVFEWAYGGQTSISYLDVKQPERSLQYMN